MDDEDAASARAEADLQEASAAKNLAGSDSELALSLVRKGYVKVDGFRRAID